MPGVYPADLWNVWPTNKSPCEIVPESGTGDWLVADRQRFATLPTSAVSSNDLNG